VKALKAEVSQLKEMEDLPPPLVPRSLGISEESAGRDY